ncbi:protein [Escherichia coli]|nr:protein [Escherichia coli]
MDQVVVFQKMFEQVRKEQNFSWFYSELKHHRIAHYIYYLATDNIRIITHDDTVLLLRGTRNLLKVREGANKRGNSSRLTQSFHFFMFEPIFSPVNALNQPI